ncbi:MAG: SIR2 family NAD-dependent protein deacylase [Gemmatimonadaceae bacterium]
MTEIDRVAERLRTAARIAVLTGAGISAESGIPTFREAQTGLWSRFRPEDLASPGAFARDPKTVWDWYRWRRELVDRAAPNAGHKAIAELQRRVPGTVLMTQNVDGLHQSAGSTEAIELHGSIRRARCDACHAKREWSSDESEFPPRCNCGSMLRPDIVWFGEQLSETELARAFAAAESCDLFLSVGTSNLVQPAASLPWIAASRRAIIAVVNVSMDRQAQADNVVHLTGQAGVILPCLLELAFDTPA